MISVVNDEIAVNITELISVLQRNSFINVELRKIDNMYLHDISMETLNQYSFALKENGINVTLIDSPIGKNKFDFNLEKKFFNIYIQICKIFQCKYLRIFSDVGDDIIKSLKYYNDVASKNNIILLLENEKGTYGESCKNILGIMKKNFSNIYHLYDVENYNSVGEDHINNYDVLKRYIKYIHLRDKKQGKYVIPFEGDLRLKELADKISSDLIISLETHLPMVSEEKRDVLFNKSLRRLKYERVFLW